MVEVALVEETVESVVVVVVASAVMSNSRS